MRSTIIVAVALVAAGCSSSGAPSTGPEASVPTTSTAPASSAVTTSVEAPVDTSDQVEPVDVASVRIDVDVAGAAGELIGTLDESEDPFGRFVSCSGLREVFGTYSVLASDVSGDVRSISLVTNDPVPAPGVYDAVVRVEFETAPAVDATGTMTVEDGFRSGSYVAFDAGGERVGGSFDCDAGNAPAPLPLQLGTANGELEAVEVVTLLRHEEAQRLVGVAVTADGAEAVECPGAIDPSDEGDVVVRVDGADDGGAVSTFVLTGGEAPTLQLRVGSVEYEFDEVRRGGADEPAAGTFSAVSADVSVDGAFRCS